MGIAHAQTGRAESQAELEASQTDEAKTLPSKWIVGASGGMIARTANDAEPFVAGGISRKLGRGYIRLSATTYRSTFRQVDAVLPSRFTIGALSGGATFGLWFVDGYASYGRQSYGGVTTALGTRPSQVGTGSPVQGAGASGGRFISLGGKWWLTASGGVQLSQNRALRQRLERGRPIDYESRERALTGSGTLRIDRYFGTSSQHIAGMSVSRVQTSNGAVSVSGPPGSVSTPNSIPDGWTLVGASSSVRLSRRLWLDVGVTQTIGARAGDVVVATLGARFGF